MFVCLCIERYFYLSKYEIKHFIKNIILEKSTINHTDRNQINNFTEAFYKDFNTIIVAWEALKKEVRSHWDLSIKHFSAATNKKVQTHSVNLYKFQKTAFFTTWGNFTNIFLPITFCRNNTNTNCTYRKAVRITLVQKA